ncbi:MAG: hypothetical protein EXR79_01105 [Myxococcales bacterium]|nr:hypothetical protein [Myxococcales bacterium]
MPCLSGSSQADARFGWWRGRWRRTEQGHAARTGGALRRREHATVTEPTDLLELPAALRVPVRCPTGAEPLAHSGGRAGALVLHGLTGSPWEVRPLADAFVTHGFSVALPVLAGHATSVRALQGTGWRDWLASADAALAWLDTRCDRIHLCGLSMGALLALLLARHRRPQVGGPARRPLASVALLATALHLPGWQRVAAAALTRLGWPEVLGKDAPDLPGAARPPCYDAIPLNAVTELEDLQDVVRRGLGPLPCPVLALHGAADRTVPCRAVLAELTGSMGPGLVAVSLPRVGHLLPRTEAGSEVVRRVMEHARAADLAWARSLPDRKD